VSADPRTKVRLKPDPGRTARALLIVAVVLVFAATLAPTALADNGGFTLIEPNSPNAAGIENVWWFVTVFAVAIFVLVEVVLVLFVVRYRRSRRRDRFDDGPDIHGSTKLELMWTAGPVLILALIAAFVFIQLPGISDPPEAEAGVAADALEVRVLGRQFYWQYEYPNGVVSIDALRVPTGVPVRLELIAPEEDVIHSWWIPALQGKRDVIPGSPQELWFRADRPGTFVGQCTELCGAEHAQMTTTTEAVSRAEFARWLADESSAQQSGDSSLGEAEWEGACAKCHGLAGEGGIAPRIAGSPILGDREALENLVRNGKGRMPPVGSEWSETQIDALFDYLRETPPNGQQG
jgi:cytochrome c oxidase subunit II